MSDRYLLRIAHHPDPDRIGRVRFLYPGERLEIGRNSTAFGPDGLQDPRMSRAHARIISLSYGVVVEDLGSRNGTIVNSVAVRRTDVDPGDLIGMGRVILQVGAQPRERLQPTPPPGVLVATSPAMWPVLDSIEDLAQASGVTIISGPQGSGRVTVARALHETLRRPGSVVTLPLAGVADDRIDATIHGHAMDPQAAPLGRADGGTLVFTDLDAARPAAWDAVAELIQTCRQRPRGGAPVDRDVKLVITMSRDPNLAQASGDLPPTIWRHAQDRMIKVPPLSSRREDILPLARRFAMQQRGWPVRLDRALAMQLGTHHWPGECDELESIMARIADEQRDLEILTLPDWADGVFGPGARAPNSTFDSVELLPPRRRR